MITTSNVRERLLATQPPSDSAIKVLKLLEREAAKPVSTQPATVTVSEALRLWRTRLKNVEITKAPIQGIEDLLTHLEKLAPQRHVDQFGFIGPETAITIFFTKSTGSYLGSAISDLRSKH